MALESLRELCRDLRRISERRLTSDACFKEWMKATHTIGGFRRSKSVLIALMYTRLGVQAATECMCYNT